MALMDLFTKIKRKVGVKLRHKALVMKYIKFCKKQEDLKSDEAFEDKALEKFVKKDVYITEEECEEYVKYLQKQELESDRYKEIKQFLNQYNNRGYIDLEKRLFELVGDVIQIRNKNYNTSKTILLERYIELKEFIDALNDEHINNNPYLSLAKSFMETSLEDCEAIKKQLPQKIADFLESTYSFREFNIIVKMSEKTQRLMPRYIVMELCDDKIQNNKFKLSKALDEEHINIYREYNEYSIKANDMMNNIYYLQICNMVSTYPVFFLYCNILRDYIDSVYLIKKQKIYNLSEQTKENIARAVGLSFDEIVSMTPDELEKYIEEKLDINLKETKREPRHVLKKRRRKNIKNNL